MAARVVGLVVKGVEVAAMAGIRAVVGMAAGMAVGQERLETEHMEALVVGCTTTSRRHRTD